MTHILRLEGSPRSDALSVSRRMTDAILSEYAEAAVTTRDLAQMPLPQLDATWVKSTFTPEDDRTPEEIAALRLSDSLVAELQAADVLVIGLPIYNFGVPAAVKLWMDQVARAGVTFKYGENGPIGLLTGKKAIVAYAAGGVPMGSPVDFATAHMRQFLKFLGIEDVTFVTQDQVLPAQAA